MKCCPCAKKCCPCATVAKAIEAGSCGQEESGWPEGGSHTPLPPPSNASLPLVLQGGSPKETARRVLNVAQAMHLIISKNPLQKTKLALRAGVHIGPVVSGIIGKTMFAFDVWGDTVNLASRMESTGVPMATQVTQDVYDLLRDVELFRRCGLVDVKGKGPMQTYINLSPTTAPDVPVEAEPHLSHEANVLFRLISFFADS